MTTTRFLTVDEREHHNDELAGRHRDLMEQVEATRDEAERRERLAALERARARVDDAAAGARTKNAARWVEEVSGPGEAAWMRRVADEETGRAISDREAAERKRQESDRLLATAADLLAAAARDEAEADKLGPIFDEDPRYMTAENWNSIAEDYRGEAEHARERAAQLEREAAEQAEAGEGWEGEGMRATVNGRTGAAIEAGHEMQAAYLRADSQRNSPRRTNLCGRTRRGSRAGRAQRGRDPRRTRTRAARSPEGAVQLLRTT